MDFILSDHSPTNLETTFDSLYLYDHPLYSLMAEKTEIKWLLVVPKQTLDASKNLSYIQELYGAIYELIAYIQQNKIAAIAINNVPGISSQFHFWIIHFTCLTYCISISIFIRNISLN